MGVEEAVCMKGGTDESSYTNNSILQRNIIRQVIPVLEENIRKFCSNGLRLPKCLNVADLGCSSGPNTFLVLQTIIDVVVSSCRSLGVEIPELNAYVNDLPQNDFNTIFQSLPGFYREINEEKGVEIACFVSGTPGSFYGRLFPTNTIHFMHSSTSLHFLSQVPKEIVMGKDGKKVALNGTRIFATKEGPPEVLKAYREHYAKDFTLFLSCRSKEIVSSGRILLNMPCTRDDEPSPVLECTCAALNQLVSQGLIAKEKLEDFNLPTHTPTIKEVLQLLEAEGSFVIDEQQVSFMPWKAAFNTIAGTETRDHPSEVTKFIASSMRAGLETMLKIEFGEEIVEPFFSLVQDMILNNLEYVENSGGLTFSLSLIKKV